MVMIWNMVGEGWLYMPSNPLLPLRGRKHECPRGPCVGDIQSCRGSLPHPPDLRDSSRIRGSYDQDHEQRYRTVCQLWYDHRIWRYLEVQGVRSFVRRASSQRVAERVASVGKGRFNELYLEIRDMFV